MEIGAIGYSPYVYRVNQISASSLNRVSPIGDDLLASKTDFSDLAKDENVTVNPLKRGETSNFADVLAMQLQMGRLNADRIFQNPVQSEAQAHQAESLKVTADEDTAEVSLYQSMRAAQAYESGGAFNRIA